MYTSHECMEPWGVSAVMELAHPMMILLGNYILASKDVLVSKEYNGYSGGSTLQSAWVKSIAQMLN